MPLPTYTVEEVNRQLPYLSDLMGDLLERRGYIVSSRHELHDLLADNYSNVGSAKASAFVVEMIAIEKLIIAIQELGCRIKDLNGGLVDFLSRREGRLVHLCWRYGEPLEIQYFHELGAGFHGRQLI